MKKVIQSLLIVILLLIIALIITFVFNPFNLRTKLVSSVINSYLTSTFKGYAPSENTSKSTNTADVTTNATGTVVATPEKSVAENNKNPLLSDEQKKQLESYGVDVSKLPQEITPGMEACFIEILGKDRVDQIVKGASPSLMEFLKVNNCLGK